MLTYFFVLNKLHIIWFKQTYDARKRLAGGTGMPTILFPTRPISPSRQPGVPASCLIDCRRSRDSTWLETTNAWSQLLIGQKKKSAMVNYDEIEPVQSIGAVQRKSARVHANAKCDRACSARRRACTATTRIDENLSWAWPIRGN